MPRDRDSGASGCSTLQEQVSPNAPSGRVLTQSPVAGSAMTVGAAASVTVAVPDRPFKARATFNAGRLPTGYSHVAFSMFTGRTLFYDSRTGAATFGRFDTRDDQTTVFTTVRTYPAGMLSPGFTAVIDLGRYVEKTNLVEERVSTMPYAIGPAERAWLAGQATGQWETSMPWTTIAPQTQVISGVTCRVYRAATETNDHAKSKLSTLKDAIKRLQDAGLMYVDGDVHEFKVGLYDTGPSRGLVYFDGVNPLPTVVLQLGNRVSEHVKAGTTSANCGTAGGETAMPPRVIADRVYDYYKPTQTVSGKDRCQIAQAMHELGHVFHQLLSPAEYALNADVASKPSAADTTAMAARRALLPNIVTAGKTHVSQYAGVTGDAKTLNEFVAEVFSGLMMGVDWNTIDPTHDVMARYGAMGGPVPHNLPSTMSRLATFKIQECQCAGAGDATVWGQDAKITW